MGFAVEVTTDTTAHNEKSLEALPKKQPQPQEVHVSADGSTYEKGAEATNTVDFSPIQEEIKNKANLAKKSAFKSLGLYLQGLAKGLIDDNVENVCCGAVDTTTLDEEGTTKSTTCVEKEMEERNQTAEISPSVPNAQQQQTDVEQAIVPTSEDEAGNDGHEAAANDAGFGPNEDVESKSSEDTGIVHLVTPNADADNTGEYSSSGKSTDEQSKEKYLSDLAESKIKEGDDDEEASETSKQKIEKMVIDLFWLLEERNVSHNVSIGDVVAVVEKSVESSNAGTAEEDNEESACASHDGSIGDIVAVLEKSEESSNADTTIEAKAEENGGAKDGDKKPVLDDARGEGGSLSSKGGSKAGRSIGSSSGKMSSSGKSREASESSSSSAKSSKGGRKLLHAVAKVAGKPVEKDKESTSSYVEKEEDHEMVKVMGRTLYLPMVKMDSN